MARVLLIGESWFSHTIHQKGFDSFTTSEYTKDGEKFCQALVANGHTVARILAHEVADLVPDNIEGYADYDVVVISDVGANSFLLGPQTIVRSEIVPNKLSVIANWVRAGGGLLMVGGYMSFTGIDGKARFGQSPLSDVLPVIMADHDDRVEVPEGVAAVRVGEHPATPDLDTDWPQMLGYNQVEAKPGAEVLATFGNDPLIVVGQAGAGRSAAFTSDLAPHWAPPEFLAWEGYGPLWHRLITWLGRS